MFFSAIMSSRLVARVASLISSLDFSVFKFTIFCLAQFFETWAVARCQYNAYFDPNRMLHEIYKRFDSMYLKVVSYLNPLMDMAT